MSRLYSCSMHKASSRCHGSLRTIREALASETWKDRASIDSTGGPRVPVSAVLFGFVCPKSFPVPCEILLPRPRTGKSKV